MTEALALREQLVERLAEGDVKPTVNDVLVKLVGRRARPAHGGQRDVHAARRSTATRPRTSGSRSPRRRASSCR